MVTDFRRKTGESPRCEYRADNDESRSGYLLALVQETQVYNDGRGGLFPVLSTFGIVEDILSGELLRIDPERIRINREK